MQNYKNILKNVPITSSKYGSYFRINDGYFGDFCHIPEAVLAIITTDIMCEMRWFALDYKTYAYVSEKDIWKI